MYIGRIGDGSNQNDGIYVLVKEVIDNAIDEFIMGAGKKVEVTFDGQRVSVRDYGRGIPLVRWWIASPRSTPAANTQMMSSSFRLV